MIKIINIVIIIKLDLIFYLKSKFNYYNFLNSFTLSAIYFAPFSPILFDLIKIVFS